MLKALFRAVLSVFVSLYRATHGRFGGKVQGLPVLLLTTTGRKTGEKRTRPLGYFEHDGTYVVIASNAGFEAQPAWYLNLRSDPRVQIEIQDKRLTALAEPAKSSLRDELWAELVKRAPGYDAYRTRTTREIPVVLLRPVEAG